MKNRQKLIILTIMICFLSIFIMTDSNTEALDMKGPRAIIGLPEIVNYYDTERMIIIGDSRMYAASKIIDDEDIIFIAKNGATCGYLHEVAEKEVDKILSENPDEHFTIFINLGVNDLNKVIRGYETDGKEICSAEDYVNDYKKLKEKWDEHNLFFASVNPINEEKASEYEDMYSNNKLVKEFNSYVSSNVFTDGVYYCDTYKILMNNGYETVDALHYEEDTSKEIISIIKECESYKSNEKSSYVEPIVNQLRAISVDKFLQKFGAKIKIFDYYI